MRPKYIGLLIAVISLSFIKPTFAIDKVYKTYQDYLDKKPSYIGDLQITSIWALVTYEIACSIITNNGQKVKIPKDDIWGFERQLAVYPRADSIFLYRVEEHAVYLCLSRGAFNCWVTYDRSIGLLPIKGYSAEAYTAPPTNIGPSNQGASGCFYNTSIDGKFKSLAYASGFFKLIDDTEKDAVKAVLKKQGYITLGSAAPEYVIQIYNYLYPQKAAQEDKNRH